MNVLHEIAEVIGPDMAVKLGQLMGGARLYVPAKVAEDHPFSLILGASTAQKLCDYYCGDVIEVPCKKVFRQVRNDIISREYHSMTPEKENRANILALKYGLTSRQVLNIARLAA
ncbi:MAG: hypothetical protein HamCj_08190 [Candidatus Hamiltonella defensa (Ceratovacuna japonica)]